ncbi:MAG: alpha/beta fold hydrolase [Balneolaceae bacterium]|nr:alpha/beta fold hydrolase [Balneolaceae bacterium]MBO6547047.1 alpha/beta fold hydrolase [Balneolaceae bacterium]MBO6648006.1 alpha/beta fold hydrolase [Balneolaceae bacterium]
MSKTQKTIVSTTATLAVLYVLVCIYFYSIQNAILFNPTKLDEGHAFNYTFDFEERWFDIEEGVRIHSIHAKADSSKGLVIYYHGNGGSADTSPQKFELFLESGYDVLYPDYREYGLSTGDLRNEDDLVGDMKVVYQQMLEEYDEKNIIVLGYSLGSGVAALVAAENNPRELIIWTPYYSMVDMKNAEYWFLPTFLVRYPLRTDLALPKIDEPITIFYAEEDTRLPVERGIKLNQFLDGNDEYIMLEGQGHNGVFHNPKLQEKMKEILAR